MASMDRRTFIVASCPNRCPSRESNQDDSFAFGNLTSADPVLERFEPRNITGSLMCPFRSNHSNWRDANQFFMTAIGPVAAIRSLQSRRTKNRVTRRPRPADRDPEQPGTLDYWMTASARCSNVCGIVRPSAFAVFKLTTNSNLFGCSTGRSLGLAPLRIRSM